MADVMLETAREAETLFRRLVESLNGNRMMREGDWGACQQALLHALLAFSASVSLLYLGTAILCYSPLCKDMDSDFSGFMSLCKGLYKLSSGLTSYLFVSKHPT